MMEKLRLKGKDMIKTCDLFSHPITQTYKDQSEYQTVTGGIISIMLICTFIGLFASTLLEAINKENVDFQESNHVQENPKAMSLTLDNNFMFALGLTNIDLVNGPRYFDFFMEFRNYNSSSKIRTDVPLAACKRQHWDNIGYGATFDRVKMNTWLCVQEGPNFKMQLQGKYTSQTFKHYKIGVRKCNQTLDPLRPCVNDSVIQQYLDQNQAFIFNFYYINTIVNPCNQTANRTYLDDANYFYFSKEDGTTANIYISEYEMDTDESLSPVEDHYKESGAVILDPAEAMYYKVRGTEYLKFYIRKSPIGVEITRSYRKIDDVISYVGGLFSFLLIAFGFVSLYNQYSYHIEVTRRAYFYDKGEPFDHNFLNIFRFPVYLIFMTCRQLGINLNWPQYEKLHRFLKQSRQHLDISLKYEKIQFSQKLAKALLTEKEYAALLVSEPYTLKEAQQIRQDLRRYKRFRKQFFKDQEPQIDFDDSYDNEDDTDQSQSNRDQLANPQNLHQAGSKIDIFADDRIQVPVIVAKQIPKQIIKGKSLEIVLKVVKQAQKIIDENNRRKKIEDQMDSKIGIFIKCLEEDVDRDDPRAKKIWDKVDQKIKDKYAKKRNMIGSTAKRKTSRQFRILEISEKK